MAADEPFALFLTWTTYGTWLPGDERGYVSNTLQADGTYRGKQNRVGILYERDDWLTRERARELQKGPTVWLTADQAQTVAGELVASAEARSWRIPRAAVMPNHVHVLVADCPDDGSAVQRILKGRSQAALSRSADQPQRWWTKRGSKRYLHGSEAIAAVTRYIETQKSILAFVRDRKVVAVEEAGEASAGTDPPENSEPPG